MGNIIIKYNNCTKNTDVACFIPIYCMGWFCGRFRLNCFFKGLSNQKQMAIKINILGRKDPPKTNDSSNDDDSHETPNNTVAPMPKTGTGVSQFC